MDFTWRVSDCEELVGGYTQGKIVQSITLLRFQI